MAHPQRNSKIIVEPAFKHGVFANAFRIVDETGPDCFLDYMVYSENSNEATVVARVRDEAIVFDLRTIQEGEFDDVVAAVRDAQGGGVGTDEQSE